LSFAHAIEVELIEGLAGVAGGATQAHRELLLFAAGDFVADQQCDEIDVGHLGVDGLSVACIDGQSRMPDSRNCSGWPASSGMTFMDGYLL
jgi:hypothetical protein